MFALIAAVSSCGGDDAAPNHAGQDAGDAGGSQCPNELSALIAFVQANKSCTADSQCVYVPSKAELSEHCAGGFYLNSTYDKSTYGALESVVCPSDREPCAMTPFAGACWHGICRPDSELDVADICLEKYGGDTACNRCTCSECFGCGYADDKCLAIYSCALNAGCLGTAACDVSSKSFPCKAEVDAAGGIGSLSVTGFSHTNQCLADWQCNTACSSG